MTKAKVGDGVRSTTETAIKNEVLAKFVCHNICCLISAMYELGITPEFDSAVWVYRLNSLEGLAALAAFLSASFLNVPVNPWWVHWSAAKIRTSLRERPSLSTFRRNAKGKSTLLCDVISPPSV